MRWMLRSKIHKATVTEADLRYVGSITIDQELMEMVGLLPGERVLVVSNKKGDEIIIMGFELTDKPVESKQIVLGPHNEFVRWLATETANTWLPEAVGAR